MMTKKKTFAWGVKLTDGVFILHEKATKENASAIFDEYISARDETNIKVVKVELKGVR